MMNERQRIGRKGEDLGVTYLQARGYTILDRNFRTRQGEIDIIAAKDGGVIFVEVKTRSNNDHGFPEEAVTYRKQMRMQAAAQAYLDHQHQQILTWQFDIIAITLRDAASPEIEHIENVIC